MDRLLVPERHLKFLVLRLVIKVFEVFGSQGGLGEGVLGAELHLLGLGHVSGFFITSLEVLVAGVGSGD